MTQPDPSVSPAPNLALLKGVVVGLGVLLIGGFAVVIAMLVAGPADPGPPPERLGPVTLRAGESILETGLAPDRMALVIGRDGLPVRLVEVSLGDGTVRETPITIETPRP